MASKQKVGGWAALIAAATFVFGFVLYATSLSEYTTGGPTPSESVAFLADHQTSMFVFNLVIFIVFGAVLVFLVQGLHERLGRAGAPLTGATTAFGVIWAGLVIAAGMIANLGMGVVVDLFESSPAEAETVWSALDAVESGLGGGNEIVGGLWVLLISWSAIRSKALPSALAYLGGVIGLAGVATVVPALEDVGGMFGLGLIVWFVWVGVVLLRTEAA